MISWNKIWTAARFSGLVVAAFLAVTIGYAACSAIFVLLTGSTGIGQGLASIVMIFFIFFVVSYLLQD